MAVTTTYPGVYIEEVPSGVHPITGVATSIAAFVDFFPRGPMNEAVQLFGFPDFERVFGGLHARSDASYAIQQFFLNGGTEAWAVRVAGGAAESASIVIRDGIGGSANKSLTIGAASEGAWGQNVRVRIDPVDTANGIFNLNATEYALVDGTARPVITEQYLNLVMDDTSPNAVEKVLKRSSLVRATKASPTAKSPAPNGLLTDEIGEKVTFSTGETVPSVDVTIDGTTGTARLSEKPAGAVALTNAAELLQAAIRSMHPDKPAFTGATVDVHEGKRLRVLAGPGGDPKAKIDFAASADTKTVKDLKLDTATSNVQEYVLGAGAVTNSGQAAGDTGADGDPPDANALLGSAAATPPTGMFALDKVDLFNILCLPRISRRDGTTPFPETQVTTVITTAAAYCERRHAFLLVDTPSDVTTLPGMKEWLTSTLDGVRHKNAAAYFPRVETADPLHDFRPISVGASGTIAGVYARTDAERGVWKAPAGTDSSLRNVQRLELKLNDQENGVLNPLGVNCLRTFDVYGNVSWGARTLVGDDQRGSDWKYVPVRRLALFLEESLYRGTKWVVFEPNDEPLWAQIRLNVGAFMHDLFRLGAFQGKTPREAYLVKCDSQTTTQSDIDHGIVNIVVGFAPLKPAEFVILRIQQLAGQIET